MGRGRWRAALRALGAVEDASQLDRPWRWATYSAHGDVAVRRGTDVPSLPRALRVPAAEAIEHGRTIRGRCGADLLRLGKFDVDAEVRLRAFYVGRGEETSCLRLQGHVDPKTPGVMRAVRARRQVAEHAPTLAPTLLEHRIIEESDLGYLRETVVRGRPPKNRGEVEALCLPVASRLQELHRGVGIEARPLSVAASDDLAEGWRAFGTADEVPDRLRRCVEDLIAADRDVEVSLCHGDLVASNILVFGAAPPEGNFALVDWEHARKAPIAFDLAKLHLNAREPAHASDLLRYALGGTVGVAAGSYRLEEQLALAQVQMLSWHRHRVARARAAGRLERLQEDTRRRVELLESLLL